MEPLCWHFNGHYPGSYNHWLVKWPGYGLTQPVEQPEPWCDLTRWAAHPVERGMSKGKPTRGVSWPMEWVTLHVSLWDGLLIMLCSWTMARARWSMEWSGSNMCHGTELEWPWYKAWDPGPYRWAHDRWAVALSRYEQVATLNRRWWAVALNPSERWH